MARNSVTGMAQRLDQLDAKLDFTSAVLNLRDVATSAPPKNPSKVENGCGGKGKPLTLQRPRLRE